MAVAYVGVSAGCGVTTTAAVACPVTVELPEEYPVRVVPTVTVAPWPADSPETVTRPDVLIDADPADDETLQVYEEL